MAHKQPFNSIYFEKAKQRILKNIIISSLTGCWNWTKAHNGVKYGVMYFKRRQQYVHRVSFELFNGKSAGRFHVCHKCDNPSCCNPDHLFLGTDKDNMEDCRRKGRGIHGSRCTNSKLNPGDVVEIKRLLKIGISQQKIAKQFRIAQTTVSGIKIGRYWKHLDDHN